MDRDVDVRTPESIEFTYQLAGLGSRFLAVALDQLLQVAIVVAFFGGLLFATSKLAPVRHAAAASSVSKTAEAVAVAFVVATLFAIFFGYFIAFEALWNGQTPGKKALGIRVVRDGGYPIDAAASLVRNLIRVGEVALGYYAVSAISALISPENKRLGDIAAGTIVVRDARLEMTPSLRSAFEEPAYAPTRYLSGEERALVRRFLDRRDQLDDARRREIAASMAARVRGRVPDDLARLDDESLLERL